jgi:hypothetical protein
MAAAASRQPQPCREESGDEGAGRPAGDAGGVGVGVGGVVDVTCCVFDADRGCFAWGLARSRWLDKPIRIKGQLKLWKLPAGMEAAVIAQLGGLS